jgi:hypothetical protein
MCYTCWKIKGNPAVINEKTIQAAKLIDMIYENRDCVTGGYAHIVVHDWNLNDDNIQFCIDCATKREYNYIGEEGRQACLICLAFLKTLTEEERYSSMAICNGFIDANAKTG